MKIFDEITCSTGRYAPLPGVSIAINRQHWVGTMLLLCALSLSACGGSDSSSSDTEVNCVIGVSPIGDCRI